MTVRHVVDGTTGCNLHLRLVWNEPSFSLCLILTSWCCELGHRFHIRAMSQWKEGLHIIIISDHTASVMQHQRKLLRVGFEPTFRNIHPRVLITGQTASNKKVQAFLSFEDRVSIDSLTAWYLYKASTTPRRSSHKNTDDRQDAMSV